MKFRLEISMDREEEIIAVVHKPNSLTEEIERLVREDSDETRLIHLFTLYADYIVIYCVNGWIDVSHILLFTAIFFAGYAVVWVIVFASISAKVRKMNANLNS